MIWIGLFAALIAVFLFALRFVVSGHGRKAVTLLTFPAVLAAIGAIAVAALVAVPAGHVGVPVLFGRVQSYGLDEGLHVINPFADVTNLSVRTETYTMARGTQRDQSVSGSYASLRKSRVIQEEPIAVLSSDGLQLMMDVTVMYRLEPNDAPLVYQKFGPDYVMKIVRPAARSAVREATNKYTSQEAYSTKREELTNRMKEMLVQRITAIVGEHEVFATNNRAGVRIEQVLLRNVDLPVKVKQAIEEKLAAEQDAQRMQFTIQKETQEAERKRIEAQGIADFQRIVSEGINDDLLRWKGIEATMQIAGSSNAKVIIIGSGDDGLPIILNPDGR